MSGRPAPVFLHIGPMKTGTTYLQQVMVANRDRLRAVGYLFAGDTWARQVRGTRDVLRLDQWDPAMKAASTGEWRALTTEMLRYSGVASIVSMEFLSFAGRRGAARVVRSLQPADVHVVVAGRDAIETIPSLWQTTVYNGSAASWPQFNRSIRKSQGVRGRLGRLSRDRSLREFLDAQGVPRILAVWARVVPPGNLHVVTVPARGSAPGLLWSRFADVVGLDPDTASEPPAQTNASLGYASTELLRRVNRELGRLRPSDYNATLKEYLALKVLAGRRGSESRPRPDSAARRFGAGWNDRVRRAVQDSGATVTGDLDDLPTDPGDPPVPGSPPPAPHELLEVAATAAGALHDLVRQRSLRLRRRSGRSDIPVPDRVAFRPDHWDNAPDPTAAAVTEVADLARTAMMLYRRLRTGAP